MQVLFEILKETLLDTLKLLPFLFITYLIMEYLEHKTSNKVKKTIQKSGKFGPILGGIVGIFPQCGFSVSATNLYSARVITLGTLISVYLSTSDEMLPILLTESIPITTILTILGLIICNMLWHGCIDALKANQKKINLVTDQLLHLVQIFVSWYIYLFV